MSNKKPRVDHVKTFLDVLDAELRRLPRPIGEGERRILIGAIRECIEHIVADVTRRSKRPPTANELLAICILAKKVFLGYDYNRLVVHGMESDPGVMRWQFDYLQQSGWRPCEWAQRKYGELPPVLARTVNPELTRRRSSRGTGR